LTPKHDLYLRVKTFSALNGVRCLCCLAIIMVHVKSETPKSGVIEASRFGVDLFFVISGFLIVTLLIRECERLGTLSLQKFYTRRTLRIFPIYYLLIFAVFFTCLAISPWRPNSLRYYLLAFPVLLTYTQGVVAVPIGNSFHCWSLAMDEQFYLIWPTIEKFTILSLRWVILGGMLLVNEAVNFDLFDGLITRIYGTSPKLPIYLITFTPILPGVLLAYLLHSRRSFEVLYRVLGYRWPSFVF
jgi:peptidoglycan/LPS O-acetylase OafA/YrhL